MPSSEKEFKSQGPTDLTTPHEPAPPDTDHPPPPPTTCSTDHQQAVLFGQLQSLEASINSKFTELLTLLQIHDKTTKQILKSHQSSVKQSVKTQLEKSHAEMRKYVDEAMMNPGLVMEMLDERIKKRVDEGIKNMKRGGGEGGWLERGWG